LAACVLVLTPAAKAQDGQFFDSNGVQIHYIDQGEGEPVVLVHGFAGSAEALAIRELIVAAGYRVIALDCRGHGRSDKPHDPQQYGLEMVRDVVRLMDHLDLDRAHVAGYSMGGLIANNLRAVNPDRLLTATLGGYGWPDSQEALSWNRDLAAALDQDDLGPLLREQTPPGEPLPTDAEVAAMNALVLASNDLTALAAVVRGYGPLLEISADNLRANTVPTLALVGERDPTKSDVERLANVMSHLDVIEIPEATHMTAPMDRKFIENLVAFLDKHRTN
jgi:pimeloyl-ACP methyl ester carboxylesterase